MSDNDDLFLRSWTTLEGLSETAPAPKTAVHEPTIVQFHEALDQIRQALGVDLSQYRVDDSLLKYWDSDRPTPPRRMLSDHYLPKLSSAVNYVREVRRKRGAKPVEGHSPLDRRLEILSTLVDMHYRDPQEILLFRRITGEVDVSHPFAPADFNPEWAHLQALAQEGSITLHEDRRGDVSVGIPSRVIAALRDKGAEDLRTVDQKLSIERLAHSQTMTNIVSGGVQYVTQAAGNAAASIVVNHVSAGDIEALRRALLVLGLSPADVSDLEGALAEDAETEGGPSLGSRARSWLADVTGRIVSQGVVAAAGTQADEAIEIARAVRQALTAYIG